MSLIFYVLVYIFFGIIMLLFRVRADNLCTDSAIIMFYAVNFAYIVSCFALVFKLCNIVNLVISNFKESSREPEQIGVSKDSDITCCGDIDEEELDNCVDSDEDLLIARQKLTLELNAILNKRNSCNNDNLLNYPDTSSIWDEFDVK